MSKSQWSGASIPGWLNAAIDTYRRSGAIDDRLISLIARHDRDPHSVSAGEEDYLRLHRLRYRVALASRGIFAIFAYASRFSSFDASGSLMILINSARRSAYRSTSTLRFLFLAILDVFAIRHLPAVDGMGSRTHRGALVPAHRSRRTSPR